MHPFGLSYYNALVGGLPGAERLGLELTYWGDAVDRVLLDRLVREVPPDETAALVPTLYPGQGIVDDDPGDGPPLAPPRRRGGRRPGAAGSSSRDGPPTGVPSSATGSRRGAVVFERRRQGVWLSAIVRAPTPARTPASTPNVQTSP